MGEELELGRQMQALSDYMAMIGFNLELDPSATNPRI